MSICRASCATLTKAGLYTLGALALSLMGSIAMAGPVECPLEVHGVVIPPESAIDLAPAPDTVDGNLDYVLLRLAEVPIGSAWWPDDHTERVPHTIGIVAPDGSGETYTLDFVSMVESHGADEARALYAVPADVPIRGLGRWHLIADGQADESAFNGPYVLDVMPDDTISPVQAAAVRASLTVPPEMLEDGRVRLGLDQRARAGLRLEVDVPEAWLALYQDVEAFVVEFTAATDSGLESENTRIGHFVLFRPAAAGAPAEGTFTLSRPQTVDQLTAWYGYGCDHRKISWLGAETAHGRIRPFGSEGDERAVTFTLPLDELHEAFAAATEPGTSTEPPHSVPSGPGGTSDEPSGTAPPSGTGDGGPGAGNQGDGGNGGGCASAPGSPTSVPFAPLVLLALLALPLRRHASCATGP